MRRYKWVSRRAPVQIPKRFFAYYGVENSLLKIIRGRLIRMPPLTSAHTYNTYRTIKYKIPTPFVGVKKSRRCQSSIRELVKVKRERKKYLFYCLITPSPPSGGPTPEIDPYRAKGAATRKKRKEKIWGRVDLWSQLYGRNGHTRESGCSSFTR